MMRLLTIFIVFLFVLHRTVAGNCVCSCCKSNNCVPQVVDRHDIWLCSITTCTEAKCVEWNYNDCPPKDAYGVTKAECQIGNGSEHLLSSLFIVFGITSIIFVIKNKF